MFIIDDKTSYTIKNLNLINRNNEDVAVTCL